jgi:hypothetical protein
MNMKGSLGLVLVWLCGAACAFAQTEGAVAVAKPEPIKITDTEAMGITKTINGYVQGAMHRGHLELYDRKKGELVTLRMDRIVTDDPARVAFPQQDRVAICGECTQVELVKDEEGVIQEKELGDKYEVWFVLQRGGIVDSRVLDTFIKSVNGNPMYKWTQDSDGKWSATVVPDPVP